MCPFGLEEAVERWLMKTKSPDTGDSRHGGLRLGLAALHNEF